MAALQFGGGWARLSHTKATTLQPRYPGRVSFAPFIRASSRIQMGLKIVETYDASFELKPECQEKLHSLLSSSTFQNQVAEQLAQKSGSSASNLDYEFTGELFQPVPWSVTTRHGMPQEFEKYFDDPDYAIVNVPPNFMFQAKIFRPSKLCAIFRKVAKAPSET